MEPLFDFLTLALYSVFLAFFIKNMPCCATGCAQVCGCDFPDEIQVDISGIVDGSRSNPGACDACHAANGWTCTNALDGTYTLERVPDFAGYCYEYVYNPGDQTLYKRVRIGFYKSVGGFYYATFAGQRGNGSGGIAAEYLLTYYLLLGSTPPDCLTISETLDTMSGQNLFNCAPAGDCCDGSGATITFTAI